MTYPMNTMKSATRRAAVAMAPVLTAALALAGCAVGPNFREPAAPQVDRYTTAPLPASTASADTAGGDAQRFLEGEHVPQRWWTTFGNPELDRRVQQALRHSPSITAAQMKGFTVWVLKTVLSGRGDELLDLADTNVWRRLFH